MSDRKNRAYNKFQVQNADSERFDGRKFNKRAKGSKRADPIAVELAAREQWRTELR